MEWSVIECNVSKFASSSNIRDLDQRVCQNRCKQTALGKMRFTTNTITRIILNLNLMMGELF